MLNISGRKKIIFASFFGLFIIFSSFLLGKTDFDLSNNKIIISLEKKLSVFAQEVAPFVFPRYPQRLTHLVSQVAIVNEELVHLNEELQSTIRKCQCQYAQSQCIGGGFFCRPGPLNVFGDPCLEREKIKAEQVKIKGRTEQLTYLQNLLKKEMETGVPKELESLRMFGREDLADELEYNLKKISEQTLETISLVETNRNLPNNCLPNNCAPNCQFGEVYEIKACMAIGAGEKKPIELKFKAGIELDDLELGKIGIEKINLGLPEEIEMPKLGNLSSFTISGAKITTTQDRLRKGEDTLQFEVPRLPSLAELPNLSLSCANFPAYSSSYQWQTFPETISLNYIDNEWYFQTFEWLAYRCYSKDIEQSTDKGLDLWGKAQKICAEGETNTCIINKKEQCLNSRCAHLTEPLRTTCRQNNDKECSKKASEECTPIGEACLKKIGLNDCFNPKEVHLRINKECNKLWVDPHFKDWSKDKKLFRMYPPYNENPETYIPSGAESPDGLLFCQPWGFGATCLQKSLAMERECKNIFTEQGKTPSADCNLKIQTAKPDQVYCSWTEAHPSQYPYHCSYPWYRCNNSCCINKYIDQKNIDKILNTLDTQCEQTKELKKEKEVEKERKIPEPCNFLPLFTGEFPQPKPKEYSPSPQTAPSQIIGDFPASILGCGAAPPTVPKISFPDIIIPDIILPSFNVPPLLYIKLPSFVFEDLILGDFELCDLNACRDFFPSLDFRFPILDLPTIDIPPIPLGEIYGQDFQSTLEVPSFRLPTYALPLFQLPSLGDLIMPEMKLPAIPLPQPKLTLSFQGIDLSAIWGLVWTYIYNALGAPNYGICIDFKLDLIPLIIAFPDYYFRWPQFPRIPEIPFCKDIDQFCRQMKTSLKEVTNKTKAIEDVFNKFAQKEIQQKLDKAAQTTKKIIEENIQQQLLDRRGKIKQDIENQIAQRRETLEIDIGEFTIPAIDLDAIVNLPDKISIPWPAELKNISLAKPFGYDLPKIPLKDLKYEKEFSLKGPGFQMPSLKIDLGNLGNRGECRSLPAKGGNPCPETQFLKTLNEIRDRAEEIDKASQKIINILQ